MIKAINSIVLPVFGLFVFLFTPAAIENTAQPGKAVWPDVSVRSPAKELSLLYQKAVKQELERILVITLSQNQADFMDTTGRIERTLQIAFRLMDGNIPKSIEELTSWKVSAILAKLMVQDVWDGSARAEAIIAEILDEHILAVLEPAIAEVETELAGLEERLVVNYNRMHTELAHAAALLGVHQNGTIKQAAEAFKADLFSKQETVKTIAGDSMMATAGIGLSVVFIKQTTVIIIRVLKVVMERVLKTKMVSIGVAAADGPSPVLDCISVAIVVVGLGWSAWDLYRARHVLKPELAISMRDSLGLLHLELKDNAFWYAGELLEQHQGSATETVNKLKQSLQ